MINPFTDTYQNEYNDFTFSEIFSPDIAEDSACNYETFKSNYDEIMPLIKTSCSLEDEYIRRTFYLMYATRGNTKASGSGYDLMQWKLKFFSIMSESGEVWQQKSKIQDYLRTLDITNKDIFIGNKNIINTALNPNTTPTNTSIDELTYISQQHTTGKKKGKLEGLLDLYSLLRENVNENYIKKFDKLFTKVLSNDVYNYTYNTKENN